MKVRGGAHRNAGTVKKTQLKRTRRTPRSERHGSCKPRDKYFKATQVSLGFERSHRLVSEYFKKKGILVISYDSMGTSKNRMSFLQAGQRIITCVPKSQGGSGIVGIGKVTGAAKIFVKGGRYLSDLTGVGAQYRAEMKKIYSDSSNNPKKSVRCWNEKFKRHQASLEEFKDDKLVVASMTPWEFSRRVGWHSPRVWSRYPHNPNFVFAHIPVQWEETTNFDTGISNMDWYSLALPNFNLSTLAAVVPRKIMEAHWDALKTRLSKASSKSQGTARSTQVHAEVIKPSSAKVCRPTSAQMLKPNSAFVLKTKSVDALLASLGLSQYVPKLRAEAVHDVETLLLLSDNDLKSVGFPLGPRRKLQAALRRSRLDLCRRLRVH